MKKLQNRKCNVEMTRDRYSYHISTDWIQTVYDLSNSITDDDPQ